MSDEKRVLLLTGRPGVGKTTAVIRAAERLDDLRLRGFVTRETRDDSGSRTGFEIVTFDGEVRTLAHVEIEGGPRVSRYGVDVDAVDAVTARELEEPGAGGREEPGRDEPAPDAYLVDEIGKMECWSDRFVEAVGRLLEGDRPVVATVARRGGGLIADAKDHPRSEVWEVTRENRDALPERIEGWVRVGLGPG